MPERREFKTDYRQVLTDQEYGTLALLVGESGRPVTYLALFARPGKAGMHEELVARVAPLLGRDRAVPQVSCRPLRVQFTLRNPFIFATLAAWRPAFNRSLGDQRALYRSEEFRHAWREEMERRRLFRPPVWSRITVRDARGPGARALIGTSIATLAAERRAEPPDTLLDLAIGDDLEMLFDFPVLNQEPEGVRPLVTDPRFLIGLSDGGAHVDQLCDGYTTYLLGKWVREHQALTLETAVARLTSEVAALFGIPDRGVIAPGKVADLVLFDPPTVDDLPAEYVWDLPGGAKRLVARARGVHATLVGGRIVHREGLPTGALPGAVLRSTTT
jgi:N-acyl-D-aspartate/D-glutamate deacylase